MVHGVAGQDFVADGEREREPEHNSGVLGSAVAASGELFEEVVAAGDADFSKRQLLERRHHEGAHVSFVEVSCGSREAVFDLHVFEPVGDEFREGTVGAHPVEARLIEGAFGELLLQLPLGGGS